MFGLKMFYNQATFQQIDALQFKYGNLIEVLEVCFKRNISNKCGYYLSTGQEKLISETEIGHVFLKFLTALRAEFNVNIV